MDRHKIPYPQPRVLRRPRLVHVTTTDISLALLLGPQLEAFAAAGYEVIGVSAPGPFVERLEEAGISHIALRHATRSMAVGQDVAALGELTGLFRRLRPDIVHTHNPKPGVYGRLAARAAGVPGIVNTVHGLYATADDSLARRAVVYGLERVASACSDAELVQNQEDVATLRRLGVPSSKLVTLGNGVDLARFRPDAADRRAVRSELGVDPEEVVVGVVGRLVWEKGYREVFAAAAALRGRLPHVRFVVAGPTDEAKGDAVGAGDLRRAEAEGGIVFLGMRDDVERLYRGMDLYVLASYREGFPRSAMEAAASGIPVIATDVRGCRQVVDDGVTGLLVPPRDAQRLAAAVETLATDSVRRASMSEAALAKAAADFDQNTVIGKTLAIYARLAGAVAPQRLPDTSVSGVTVGPATEREVAAAAALHARQISGGFLATLGEGFLERLYRRASRSTGSFLLVARDDQGAVVGFLSGTEDVAALYRQFVLRDGLTAGFAAAPRLAKRWRSALETLNYSRAATSHLDEEVSEVRAELLAMAVAADWKGRGVGRALVDGFTAEMGRRKVAAARVVVGDNLHAARRLYESAGFRPAGRIEVHRGEGSTVLVWP